MFNGNFRNFEIEQEYDSCISKIEEEIQELLDEKTRILKAKEGFIKSQLEEKAQIKVITK
jgi:hypothetical protein